MNKRGISPLLAAVLLIAFAIAMAAIVSTFVLKKTREFNPNVIAQESVFCESVNIGYTVDDPNSLTINTTVPSVELLQGITIINRGTFSIHKFIVSSPGLESSDYLIRNATGISTLQPGANNKYNVSIQIISGNSNKEIKLVPVIKDPEKNQFVACPDRQLLINYSQLCNEVGASCS